MCGRFLLTLAAADLTDLLELASVAEDYRPRWNIAPTQAVPVVPNRLERHLRMARWGLRPPWKEGTASGEAARPFINARSETAAVKPAFREALRSRRCLVPASGFYEWERSRTPTGVRIPFLIRPSSSPSPLLVFAGIWESSPGPDGSPQGSFAILTGPSSGAVARIHDRCPVILPPDAWNAWLSPAPMDPSTASRLMAADGGPSLEAVQVSTLVNAVAHDEPACAEPVAGGEVLTA